jgi:hypothetical protein
MLPLRQSKRVSKRATDQDASKISTRSTSRNAAAAPAASLPTATGGNNTTLDAAASIININDAPPGTGGNTTTQDAAKSIIDINDALHPPNAKSFGAIVNELRSRPVAAPLNVRQCMLSSGLNPTSYPRGQVRRAPQKFKDIVVATPPHPQASHPGVREDVAMTKSTAKMIMDEDKRIRKKWTDNQRTLRWKNAIGALEECYWEPSSRQGWL